MGRWTWLTLRGKRGIQTTIISAYRPCESKHEGAVEMQQLRYFREKHIDSDKDPLQRYDKDLKALLEEKIDKEHRVILMGDFNISMTKRNRFTKMLRDLGMKEAILDKYTTKTNKPKSTFKEGTDVIDGMWITENVDFVQGGHDEISPSGDHCWILGDFTVKSLLGGTLDLVTKPLARKLSCKLPQVKERYQQLLEEELQRHDLGTKIGQMLKNGLADFKKDRSSAAEYRVMYDKLNRQVENAIKYADKNCKKGHTGAVPFSPKTKKLQGEIIIWKAVLKYRMQRKKNLRLLKRQMKKWNFDQKWYHLSVVQIRVKIAAARVQYRRYKPRAWEERRSFLGKLAQEYADCDTSGKDASHHLYQLQRQESERAAYQRIKYALKPPRTGVNRIEIKEEDGSRKVVVDKEEMEKEIGRVDVEKLLQADNTPLRQEPLRSHFGEEGDFDKWNAFIDNELHLPKSYMASKGTRLWCSKMQSSTTQTKPTTWTEEEYINSWKRMKETTTSLPGPTFSHYKAANHDSIAAQVYSTLAIFPMLLEFAPTAWCRSVASMIPKKKEDLRPAKLRLITLLHGLFNHNNKWVGKRMMEFGEKEGKLAKEQYGSRKKKSAGQHSLNKRLILDFLRLQKLSAILIANDARSCYDRIIIMVLYITMVLFGVARETAQCLLSCLLFMVYQIQTVFGDSTFTYGGKDWPRSPHRNGQGNGSGPALWTCISSPLFDILREQGYGIHLRGPISATHLHIVGFGFVDDADLIQGAIKYQSTTALLRAAQGMINLWEEVLRITGGALDVKDKSDWTLISFQWNNGIAKLKPMEEPKTLKVKDHENDIVTMRQLEPTQARETLGVMQAPSGDESAEQQYLKEKIKKWIRKIRSSPLQRQDITRAVSVTITRTLQYGLIATALSYDQCDDLTKLLIRGVLPKMGIVQTAHTTLATSPRRLRGLGLIHLYILQLVDHPS